MGEEFVLNVHQDIRLSEAFVAKLFPSHKLPIADNQTNMVVQFVNQAII